MLDLPDRTSIVEVAPRDGLQSFPRQVETRTKIALVDILSDAGFPVIEVTSFAHPRAVPELADAEAVMAGISRRPGTIYRALAPNVRGAERAVAADADEVLGLIVISRTYLRKNQNMTLEEAVDAAIRAFGVTAAARRRFVAALGMAFWCPYEGHVSPDAVVRTVEQLHAAGVRRFYLAGSVGMEDPRRVHALFKHLCRGWPDAFFGYHVHDRAGFAPANILAALDAGASWLEGAVCGLGGGIAMPGGIGPTGNYPTEDLVHLLDSSGVATGLELARVVNAASQVASLLDVTPGSRAARLGTRSAEPGHGSPALSARSNGDRVL